VPKNQRKITFSLWRKNMAGFFIIATTILLGINLYIKCEPIVLLSFVFTWVLLIVVGQDVFKLSLQNKLLFDYIKSQETKAKETKNA